KGHPEPFWGSPQIEVAIAPVAGFLACPAACPVPIVSVMAKRTSARDDFDSPWKDALQRYLQQFLAFFFPAIAADIDWSRGYEALDKEFQQIIRRAKVGKALADKLFKVWLRAGTEHWLLIHIEIQGARETDFPAP